MWANLTGMASLVTLLLVSMAPAVWAQSREAVAVLTELKFNRGDIQVKAPGKTAPQKPPTYIALAVRGGKHPPPLISPRETKTMTDAPTFRWMGMEMQTGTLRLYGPDGQVWAAENIARTQLKY